ncbi:MAG: hypothetical protein JO117_00525, partial [Verrucomicrobia bacterium]|nr:hypothetical protein [Verrucomicrobiota bacterium]
MAWLGAPLFAQAPTPAPGSGNRPVPSIPGPVVIGPNSSPAPAATPTPGSVAAPTAPPPPTRDAGNPSTRPVPAIPPPVVLTPDGPLPANPNATPAGTPPLIDGRADRRVPVSPLPAPSPGQSPLGLPNATPPPALDLSQAERTGNGLGPVTSVRNEPHSFSRAGLPARNWIDQTQATANAKSVGCLECHQGVEPMHRSPYVVLGCTDCHGGDATAGAGKDKVIVSYRGKNAADYPNGLIPGHVPPRNPEYWRSAANPSNVPQLLNHESPEFIRFVNPGDLRIAQQACGLCHEKSIEHVANSMMTTGVMLWGAALYNNGAYPLKNYVFGQSYRADGAPQRINNPFPVTLEMTLRRGVLPFIQPLPRFNLSQPSNTLRIFEKGQEPPLELGNPEPEERPGAPAKRLTARAEGTGIRVDPVFIGLQKTRLNDPLLYFMGTNDHPGDFRSSGCTACHTVYANDRSPTNSGFWSKYGHQGLSFTGDKSIAKNERGHPVVHQFTRSIPSSQCMSCHMHQGNLFVNPYLGYTWWDQESDGEFMYPKEQHNPTDEEMVRAVRVNPEAAATRGLWGDQNFVEKVSELNPQLKNTQFADYHSHGWVFRAIFKKDKKGNMLDRDDRIIRPDDPNKWAKAVHLKDVHLERGMQCGDCHFLQDVHGDGTLYGEPRSATSIECIDCHGTVDKRPSLVTSGNGGKINLAESITPFGPRFEWRNTVDATGVPRRVLYQYSNMDPNVRWEVPQTVDTVDPSYVANYDNNPKNGPVRPHFNPKSAYAKTLHRNGRAWGDVPADADERRETLAHNNEAITCQICHTSWATSCFGCHLPQKANQRVPQNKFEGVTDRNYTTYNPQVLRDDVFMLGVDGTTKKHRMAVLRSSSAIVVSSQNSNREQVYSQQQTVSAEGYSGQAFNPHFPHTTSSVGTTKNCTDCHLSKAGDNNAWMAQFLGFGTGTVNFFGKYAWVGAGAEGVWSVAWTESDEPQAAIGSHLHRLAYPDNYREHIEKRKGKLETAFEHKAKDCRDLTYRGEFLYTANGKGGFQLYDISTVDNKGFSERFNTAPVSPLGENLHVSTKGVATALALPSTLGLDPLRKHIPENEEQTIPLYYGFIYGTDTVEGLVVIFVGPLVQGEPNRYFIKKQVSFNPAGFTDSKDGKQLGTGLLTGATHIVAAGSRLYITSPQGLSVVSVANPKEPRLVSHYGGSFLREPQAVTQPQFQYIWVTDKEGLKTFDISDPDHPVPVPGAVVPLREAGRAYAARTYVYVPNGEEGLAIIDVEKPTAPKLVQMYNAGGAINDAKAIQIGSISASMFGLLADGKNGLRVIQLISPENVPEHMGFSPKPNPILISSYPIHGGEALAVSRGLDRDRIVDETGQQTVVFGRRGSRPFHLDEMLPFLKHGTTVRDPKDGVTRGIGGGGSYYRVDDVFTRADDAGNRRLVTKSGTSLAEPMAFSAPVGPYPLPPAPSPGVTPAPDGSNTLQPPLPVSPDNPF